MKRNKKIKEASKWLNHLQKKKQKEVRNWIDKEKHVTPNHEATISRAFDHFPVQLSLFGEELSGS